MTTLTSPLCRASDRRAILEAKNGEPNVVGRWNGVDYVEFENQHAPHAILVYLLCPFPPKSPDCPSLFKDLSATNFLLWDEVAGREIKVTAVARLSGTCARLLAAEALCPGRCYRLTLRCLGKIDSRFATYHFATTADTTEVDPRPPAECPQPKPTEPQANYLARDYASFRQLLLDRLALVMPEWKERHVPDLGMTLIEAFAYVGDYLSYYQDAVATEAYLHTARQRISVRRHAQMVDYQLHEGCNARTFVHLEVEGEVAVDPLDAFFITAHPDDKYAGRPVVAAATLERAPANSFQPFEIVCTQPRQSSLEPGHITNIVGLIGLLASHSSGVSDWPAAAVARLLWNGLEPDLQMELRSFASGGENAPCPTLVDKLTRALSTIARHYRLRDDLGPPCAANGEHRVTTGERTVGDETNRSIIGAALEGYVSRLPEDRQHFFQAHNEIAFYTWNGRECCVPKGATRATLKDGEPECMRQSGDVQTQSTSNAWSACDKQSDFVVAHTKHKWSLRNLKCGDFLVFEEVLGPHTHLAGDANPAHRQVVRLSRVNCTIDPLTCQRIVEIEWEEKDALRFSLCISSVGPVELGCQLNERISVARGNVVLVDHGLLIDRPEWLGEVHYRPAQPTCDQDDSLPLAPLEPARAELLRPMLQADLTFAAPVDCRASATDLLGPKVHEGLPAIRVFGVPMATEAVDSARDADVPPPTLIRPEDVRDPLGLLLRFNTFEIEEQRRLEAVLPPASARFLQEARDNQRRQELNSLSSAKSDGCNAKQASPQGEAPLDEAYRSFAVDLRNAVIWQPKAHLMQSHADSNDFVVEIDNERRAHLRFGDNDLGRRPPAEMSFYANYRRGNGLAGNVGAEKLVHLVYRRQQLGGIRAVRNVVAATGGTDPETLDHARLLAPRRFMKLRRAITAQDYADLVQQHFADEVQQARATLNWMGSWYEIAVAIDPLSTVQDPRALLRRVEALLEKHRRVGHLLRVGLPTLVGLDIAMTVCVKAGYLRAHVRQELLDLFSSRLRSDGTQGFFSPDNFTFGDSLYMSRIVKAAKSVAGVENIAVTRFERYGHSDSAPLASGVLEFSPLEIPRLDNDPQHLERGRLCLEMRGER